MLRLVAIAAKLWFYRNWMYAGLIAGLFLLAVLPLFAGRWSVAMVAVYLQLPAYMLHQVEEHTGDRFRRYINRSVAGVPDALTTVAVVVVNVPLVWGIDLVAIYLAQFVAIGWGLIAIYLMLVNAVVHVVGAVAKRAYNPGLATAVVLFLPLSIWGLAVVSAVPGVSLVEHGLGLGLAIVLHAGLAVHVMRRARRLRAAAAA